MRRRDLLVTCFLASLARPAGAQQSNRMPVVGVLIPYSSGPGSPGRARLEGLRRGLREHGYDTANDLMIANMRTAQKLGLTIRPSILLRADEVIE